MRLLKEKFKGPVVLIILDGWGIASKNPGNAVALAKTPNFNSFCVSYPHGQLLASGEAVGLPKNEAGNSETGHLNLGSGRVVYQDLPRINLSIADGSFFKNPAFLEAVNHAKKFGSNLHLLGLVGSGGVHSNTEHLYALLRLAKELNFTRVFLHLFTDGRDSPPKSALIYLREVQEKIKEIGVGQIATVTGRYFSMDRDNRWERTQKAYEAITLGIGNKYADVLKAIEDSYLKGVNDEFIEPVILTDGKGTALETLNDNDSVIFFNFRIDRPRQLTKALILKYFEKFCPRKASFDPYAERYGHKQFEEIPECHTFVRKRIINNLFFVTMTEYEKDLPVKIAFSQKKVDLPIARIFSTKEKKQLHISETEKFPHISTFFNGLNENPYPLEEWEEVPSPKVATYDLIPEMSAGGVTEQFLRRFENGSYFFSLINFANPDMVAHTGNLEATIKACQLVDYYLGIIVKKILSQDGTAFITADHGNAEELINLETGEIDTEHSNNPVPFIVVHKSLGGRGITFPQGILADVTPTILFLHNFKVPSIMTGRPLFS